MYNPCSVRVVYILNKIFQCYINLNKSEWIQWKQFTDNIVYTSTWIVWVVTTDTTQVH